jgi:hypothetical protein
MKSPQGLEQLRTKCSSHGSKQKVQSWWRVSLLIGWGVTLLILKPASTSSKKARLQSYLSAGDLGELPYCKWQTKLKVWCITTELSAEDVETIDTAGALGEKRIMVRHGLRKFGVGVLFGILILVACSYFKSRNKRSNVAKVLVRIWLSYRPSAG